MRGLFIPEITTEMFKNGCLESIEALMAEGEIYDIEYSPWIPVSERLPDLWEVVLVTDECGYVFEYERRIMDENGNVCDEWSFLGRKIIAWKPMPERYKKGGAEK